MADKNRLMIPASFKRRRSLLVGSASFAAVLAVGIAPARAQEAANSGNAAIEEIVVTSRIRDSFRASLDVKRNGKGIVDGIVAEDIGKFPDSNLAESLQRITGVSINRQTGEGSQVTVRGFGPDFNLVTLGGRSLPSADIPLVGGDGSGTDGGGRAFDFSNLASEGVNALQVHKSGRADIASGGIGAAINIETRKPLDNDGLTGALSVKAAHDSSVDRGRGITPDLAGFLSWTDDEGKFGIGLFGGYSRRDSAFPAAFSQSWNVQSAGSFLDPANGLVTATTTIRNAPTDPDTLVSLPRDSRYFFQEVTRERINGQIVLQFNPIDTLAMTADYTFARNEAEEQRGSLSNWFNRPFSQVMFDGNPVVATTVFLEEELARDQVKDLAMENQFNATKDSLGSFGFNVGWDARDDVRVSFDAHTSRSKVSPNAPMGYSSIGVGMAMPVITAHSVDYSGAVPLISFTRDDRIFVRDDRVFMRDSTSTNRDGIYDVNDISTQVANLRTVSQTNKIDQFDLRGDWSIDDEVDVTVGTNYRAQSNATREVNFQQILGNWGATQPGDVEVALPGSLQEYCLSCQFDDFGINEVNAFRGNAANIFAAISPVYEAEGSPLNTTSSSYDRIKEDVLAFYGQVDVETELVDRGVRFSVGLRYERTDVESFTETLPTGAVIWQGDNDFTTTAGSSSGGITLKSSYDNFLPNVDLAVDVTDNMVARFSYSKTISRARYNNLFASDTVLSPPGPTALGNVATGDKGNPGLLPLESDNYDVSLEYYYGDDNYASFGAFTKRVKNFVGLGQVTDNLFGLRDPSSGAAGSRSGDALALLNTIQADRSDRNLFAMTALIQTTGSIADAQAMFQANQNPDGSLDDAFYSQLETDVDIAPDANDPLFEFELVQPINNREADVWGIEAAFQHFFGQSGFGVAASYTMVRGDVGFNVGEDPSEDQFALTGLSDTANATLIYENYGVSGRIAYNWRDKFLASTNRGGGFRNPVFVKAFATLDVNISYDVTDNVVVLFEGINLTSESLRTYGRDRSNLWFAQENAPRYFLGVRYKF